MCVCGLKAGIEIHAVSHILSQREEGVKVSEGGGGGKGLEQQTSKASP